MKKNQTKPPAQARRRGRPSQAVVTKKRLAQAGIEVAEQVGYENLTMSKIGAHLGVSKAALYNHVEDKDALLCLVEDEVMGRVNIKGLEKALAGDFSPKEALRQWAFSYRDVFSQHLPLIPFIAAVPVTGAPQTIAMYELVVQVIEVAGVENKDVITRLVAIESLIFGSAYDVHAPANILDAGEDQAPHLTEAVSNFMGGLDSEHQRADTPFELGLDALLYGMK